MTVQHYNMWWFVVGFDSVHCLSLPEQLNNECLLINDDQNSGCQYSFNNTVGPVSCHVWKPPVHVHVTTSTAVGVAKHAVIANYLTVILRHCVRKDPNNQIRLRSPIYSPAMLIKWLRYQHESSSYPAWKEVLLFTSADQILTRYDDAWYRK